MVGNYAVINSDGIVENIIVADDEFVLEGKLLVNINGINCNIGNRYENGEFADEEKDIANTPELEDRIEALEMALLELL